MMATPGPPAVLGIARSRQPADFTAREVLPICDWKRAERPDHDDASNADEQREASRDPWEKWRNAYMSDINVLFSW